MIKYLLSPLERAVAFQIIEQSNILTNKIRSRFIKEGFSAMSALHPELRRDGVFLRGSDGYNDLRVSILTFNSNEDRDIYISKVEEILERVSTEL